MSKIVGRTLDFLEVFADQKRPLSASEIARLLDIPASSCHDVLQALHERGYIYELAPRGGYYPTLRVYEVAKVIADHDPVVLRTDTLLRSLRDALDESVLLSKVNGVSATYLAAFEPSHPLRFLANIGESVRSRRPERGGLARFSQIGAFGRADSSYHHHEGGAAPGDRDRESAWLVREPRGEPGRRHHDLGTLSMDLVHLHRDRRGAHFACCPQAREGGRTHHQRLQFTRQLPSARILRLAGHSLRPEP
jgi:hypothetical protein